MVGTDIRSEPLCREGGRFERVNMTAVFEDSQHRLGVMADVGADVQNHARMSLGVCRVNASQQIELAADLDQEPFFVVHADQGEMVQPLEEGLPPQFSADRVTDRGRADAEERSQ